jgi:hypothetical protein
MASEPTDDEAVRLTLPSDLGDWLDRQASELGVTRESVLVQLLASYRTAAEFDGELAWDEGVVVDVGELEELESAVTEEVAERVEGTVDQAVADAETDLEERVERTVDQAVAEAENDLEDRVDGLVSEALQEEVESLVRAEVETAVSSAVQAQVADHVEDVRASLEDRMEELEAAYTDQLTDARNRIIQVKQEADAKAPADHDHEELARVSTLAGDIEAVENQVAALRADLEAMAAGPDEEVEARVAELDERLQTVAWVVNDLREAQASGADDAVEDIKRAAAEADVERAKCENCNEGVAIGLLTEPQCPHCSATVTDLDPGSGFFSSPQLLAAAQLESGEE